GASRRPRGTTGSWSTAKSPSKKASLRELCLASFYGTVEANVAVTCLTRRAAVGGATRLSTVKLPYLSTSLLCWQAVAGIIGVKSSNPLRSNSRCTWRHSEDARNVHNTAIRRALSPLHPCGSVPADVHGRPRGVAPLRPLVQSKNSNSSSH